MVQLNTPEFDQEKWFDTIRQYIYGLIEKSNQLIETEHDDDNVQLGLKSIMDKLNDCRDRLDRQLFRIAILGLVKSGKSTLINALIGDEFLPASNIPQTARVVRVQHKSTDIQGTLSNQKGVMASGAANIRVHLEKLNSQARSSDAMSEDDLILEVRLEALEDSPLSKQEFEILDTPGPNEAFNNTLRKKVLQLIEQADAIIYLLDYTKLKTLEEQEILSQLAVMRSGLLSNDSDRLFFVVNKIDLRGRNDLNLEETANYVSYLLERQFNGLKISPDRVLLVSAEQGLLARLIKSGRASEEAIQDFATLLFGKFGNLNAQDVTLENFKPYALQLAEKSQLKRLEETVLLFINVHRRRLLLESVLEDLITCFDKFDSRLQVIRTTLQTDQAVLLGKIQQLERDLNKIPTQLEVISKMTEVFKSKTQLWIQTESSRFRKHIDSLIKNSFDSNKTSSSKNDRHREMIVTVHGALKLKASNEDSLKLQIINLNNKIADYLQPDFEEFRKKLEEYLHKQQDEFYYQLKDNIEKLNRQITETINEFLPFSLNQVRLRVELPALSQLDNVDAVVKKEWRYYTYTTTVEVPVERMVRVDHFWGFLFDKYQKQTIKEEREEARSGSDLEYLLEVGKFQSFWNERINERIDQVLTITQNTFNDLFDGVDQMRTEIEEFKEKYVKLIQQEIHQLNSDVGYREHRLYQIIENINTVQKLREEIRIAENMIHMSSISKAKTDEILGETNPIYLE